METNNVETIRFRSTIKCSGCVAKVTPFLNEAVGENNWQVDTNDPSKVLTVVGEANESKTISAVEKAGFKVEKI